MNDPFLIVTRVRTEHGAMTETLKAALQQRQNKVYSRDEVGNERLTFRLELARIMREESLRYKQPSLPVSDDERCAAIRRISESLSTRYRQILKDRRFRYGTTQKAFVPQIPLEAGRTGRGEATSLPGRWHRAWCCEIGWVVDMVG